MTAALLKQRLGLKEGESTTLCWAMLYVFSLFISYFLLRPVRDELGVAGGIHNFPWLFTGTLVTMLLLTPAFSFLVKTCKTATVIKISYQFFSLNLLIFFVLLSPQFTEYRLWVGRFFFIWVSVFNLFVVSLFWSLIVDIFNAEQGKRLFGILSAGATTGAMCGSLLTLSSVEAIGQRGLILLAFAMLELSLFSALRAFRQGKSLAASNPVHSPVSSEAIGGSVFAGITHTLRSPYLSGIALFMILYSVTSTFLYLEQANFAANAFSDRSARTEFFATVDMLVNILTLLTQLFLTAKMVKWIGISFTLAILPLVSLTGFSLLLAFPTLILFVGFQVIRRVSNFAFARPSREILFTLVNKEERYKSKNFIDTVVYRLGDQMGSWSYVGLINLSGSSAVLAFIAIPLSFVWLMLSVWLGKRSSFTPLNSGGE